MKATLSLIGLIALAMTLIAPFAYVLGGASLSAAQWTMLIGTVLWFLASVTKLLSSPAEAAD